MQSNALHYKVRKFSSSFIAPQELEREEKKNQLMKNVFFKLHRMNGPCLSKIWSGPSGDRRPETISTYNFAINKKKWKSTTKYEPWGAENTKWSRFIQLVGLFTRCTFGSASDGRRPLSWSVHMTLVSADRALIRSSKYVPKIWTREACLSFNYRFFLFK